MSETNNELLAALESADQIKVGDVVTGEVLALITITKQLLVCIPVKKELCQRVSTQTIVTLIWQTN